MNGRELGVPLTDRGLAYGDGLFETLRWVNGAPWALAAHHARLQTGCAVLGLPAPTLDELQAACMAWGAAQPGLPAAGVLKILWTAGSGDRGYARPALVTPRLGIQRSPMPAARPEGLSVVPLAQPGGVGEAPWRGLKHLNRLPQVWMRARWPVGVDEVLVYDTQGLVHGGSQSNFCWFEDGRWFTPALAGDAIAGTVRAQLIRRLGVIPAPVSVGRLALATALVMTNAVRGVEPVIRFGTRRLDAAPARALQAAWQDLGAATAEDWLTVWQSETDR
ncbi:aminotransferase class IV [Halothiobacillus sp. DCM-1]|uniref:aminotransferase class IV n=1 Tax=Halothiobacillus sp. DCM-1 TaxID=3112558 RepID=UPI003247D950